MPFKFKNSYTLLCRSKPFLSTTPTGLVGIYGPGTNSTVNRVCRVLNDNNISSADKMAFLHRFDSFESKFFTNDLVPRPNGTKVCSQLQDLLYTNDLYSLDPVALSGTSRRPRKPKIFRQLFLHRFYDLICEMRRSDQDIAPVIITWFELSVENYLTADLFAGSRKKSKKIDGFNLSRLVLDISYNIIDFLVRAKICAVRTNLAQTLDFKTFILDLQLIQGDHASIALLIGVLLEKLGLISIYDNLIASQKRQDFLLKHGELLNAYFIFVSNNRPFSEVTSLEAFLLANPASNREVLVEWVSTHQYVFLDFSVH